MQPRRNLPGPAPEPKRREIADLGSDLVQNAVRGHKPEDRFGRHDPGFAGSMEPGLRAHIRRGRILVIIALGAKVRRQVVVAGSPQLIGSEILGRVAAAPYPPSAFFASRTPAPPPGSSGMNSTPFRSRAARISATALSETCRRCFSRSTIVDKPTLASVASWPWVISISARAARHCAGVMDQQFLLTSWAASGINQNC